MKLGAQCMSPLESGPGLTEAGKVEPDAAPKPVITKTRTAKAALRPQARRGGPSQRRLRLLPGGMVHQQGRPPEISLREGGLARHH
jgi:hypothetical protein